MLIGLKNYTKVCNIGRYVSRSFEAVLKAFSFKGAIFGGLNVWILKVSIQKEEDIFR